MASADAAECAFKRWIGDLRYEIDQVYSRFELIPEHWRDDFDKGRTPVDAFDRIMMMAGAAKAKGRRQ